MNMDDVLARRSEILDKKLDGRTLTPKEFADLELMRSILDIAELARSEGYQRGLEDASGTKQ
jgi:hypothetical protein